jgi:DNA polymerase I-like protein with 3'-5' exonuclease and polymerase domains
MNPPSPSNDSSTRSDRGDELQLLPHHLSHLEASGLTIETIKKAGISSITDPDQARAELNWRTEGRSPPVPAIWIPYPGADYSRLHPDDPRIDKHRRPIKYEAPVGRPSKIYIPRSMAPQIDDPAERLWVTEGEKKALAACQAGLATAAAPGVNSFHDVEARRRAQHEGRDNRQLHPDFNALKIDGREVVIVFDADIDDKPPVARAAAELAQMLRARGAATQISYLPANDGDGPKTGIDDLYVRLGGNGKELLRLLSEQVRPTEASEVLDWLAVKWSKWNADTQQLNLERALPFVPQLKDERKVDRWLETASRRLDVPKKYLKEKLTEIRRHLTRDSFNPSDPDDDWMDAPGFSLEGSGPRMGIWKERDDGKPARPVAAAPINIVEIGTAEDGTCYSTIRFKHGEEERIRTVPRAMIAGPEIIELAAVGAPINQSNRPTIQMFLQRQEAYHWARLPRIRILTRSGWSLNSSVYVLGRRVIGGDGRAIVDCDERFLDALQPWGDRAAYIALCRDVCQQSHVAEMMWAAGYAAPLLQLIDRRSFMLSIWGWSGRGKSAAQAIAMSACGRPEGLKLTGDATPTAIEAALAQARDGNLWIDDTQQARHQAFLHALAYQVGGGTGRARGTASGGLRPIRDWRALGLVSGEHPLMRLGVAAGAKNRTLELQVQPFRDSAYARHVHQELAHHSGWTAPEFIEALLERYIRPGKVRELDVLLRGFNNALADQQDELVDHVGVLTLADYLARVIIFGDDERFAHTAALTMGLEILQTARGAADSSVDTIEAGYESIQAWVVENDLAFTDSGQRHFGRYIDPKDVDGKRVVAVMPEPLRELARKADFNVEEVVHGLRDRGLLIPGENNRTQRKTPGFEGGRPRCYWIVLPPEEMPSPPPPAAGAEAGGPRQGRVPEMGQEKQPLNPDVTTDSPNVPAGPQDPAENESQPREMASASPGETTAGTNGTGGTGLGGDREEEEERSMISTSSSPVDIGENPVPPFVPPQLLPGRSAGTSASAMIGSAPARIEVAGGPTPFDLITSHEEAARACQRLSGHPLLGLDIETFSLVAPREKGDKPALDPFRNRIRLLQLADTDGRVQLFDLLKLGQLPDSLRSMLSTSNKTFAGYNIAFDVKNLLHHFGVELNRPVDLFAAAVLIEGYAGHKHSGFKGKYTLQTVAQARLGVNLDKELQRSDWSVPELSRAQLGYAAADAAVLLPLHARYQHLTALLGVARAWDIENGVIAPLGAVELAGIQIDLEAVTALESSWRAQAAEAQARALEVLGPINLHSHQQLRKALLERCNLVLPDTNESTLQQLGREVPAVQALLDYRKSTKLVSTYAAPWIEGAARDGRLHPSFDALGTPTGRMSCSNPNIQNVPRTEAARACFIPAPGHKFVVADYSAIELRVIAQLINDPELRRCFCGSPPIDPHRRTAGFIVGRSIEEITGEERARAKAINFGFTYSMGAERFIEYARDQYNVEFSLREAKRVRGKFMKLYAGIAKWHQRAALGCYRRKDVRTASGRLRVFSGMNLGEYLNTPIQGTAADGLKRALALLHPRLAAIGARVVNIVHDEFVVEAPTDRATEAKAVLVAGMQEGMTEFLPDVPVVVEAAIASTWKKP